MGLGPYLSLLTIVPPNSKDLVALYDLFLKLCKLMILALYYNCRGVLLRRTGRAGSVMQNVQSYMSAVNRPILTMA